MPWLGVVVVLAVWSLAAGAGARGLPAPWAVAAAGADLVVAGTLGPALGVSLVRFAVGAGVGVLAGLVLGLAAGTWRLVDVLVDRPVQMLRAVPLTALVPLAVVWFGVGETAKVVLVAVGAAVPVYVATCAAVREVDPFLVDAARTCGLSRRSVAVHVLLPGAVPGALVGVRYGLGVGWVALVVAETTGAEGVGALLTAAREYARVDVMLVCVALYAVLGAATDAGVRALDLRLQPWRARPRLPRRSLRPVDRSPL
ncbi:ABC transporter permease [Cellulomonas fimi]|uniref:ABC transporter permease n=1 Tax=Cellulomonas fimi TaxID=1708 RepID=UPI0002F44BEF|nr:ABC transporter permease subunit [Cellulomonas fimi]NNH05919.1 ABC transporter permease subunit [Cellulomonas fimi]